MKFRIFGILFCLEWIKDWRETRINYYISNSVYVKNHKVIIFALINSFWIILSSLSNTKIQYRNYDIRLNIDFNLRKIYSPLSSSTSDKN